MLLCGLTVFAECGMCYRFSLSVTNIQASNISLKNIFPSTDCVTIEDVIDNVYNVRSKVYHFCAEVFVIQKQFPVLCHST